MKKPPNLPGEKSLKVTFIIFADLECLLKNARSCQNRLDLVSKILTQKKTLSTNLQDTHGVQYAKNRPYFYRGKDCIEKFCKDLKELGTEIINFEKKEMIPLTNKEIKSYEKQKVCHICKKKICYDKSKKK